MLQTLREKSSGWIGSVVLGLLIIPFAFFGVNNYFDTQVETWAAKVGDQEISVDQYRSRYEQYRQQMRQMLGDNFDPRTAESSEAKLRIINGMVEEELMRQAGQRLGFAVPAAKLRSEIEKISAFQVDGKFDVQQYRLLLATQNMTPLSFEQRVRNDLQTRALPEAINDSALATTLDVDNYFRLRDQKRDLRYIRLPVPSADALPTPDEATLQAYYESNADSYMSEEKVSIEYLISDAAALEVALVPDVETLRQRYEEQKARFTEVAQRLASHILIKVEPDAAAEQQLAAQAKAAEIAEKARAEGADFAALAREYSDDIGSKAGGGDLGWIETGLFEPAFESAVFAMENGAVSDPVKTAEGWHVIQLREVRPGEVKPFEAVRDQLAAEYSETERERAHSEQAGKLIDITYRDPSTLAVAAEELGLEIKTAGPFGRAGGEDPLTRNPDVLRIAFSQSAISGGQVSDALELGEGRTGVIRVAAHEASQRLPFAEVSEQVRSDWQQSELARMASEQAEAVFARLQAGEAMSALAAELGVELNEHAEVTRGAVVADRQIIEEAFAKARPSQDQTAQALVDLAGNQKALLEVTKVEDGDVSAISADERRAVQQQLAQAIGAAETRELAAALKRSTTVRIAEDRL